MRKIFVSAILVSLFATNCSSKKEENIESNVMLQEPELSNMDSTKVEETATVESLNNDSTKIENDSVK